MAASSPGPAAPRLIDGYGKGGFRVGGESFIGSILVLPDRIVPWRADIAALGPDDFADVLAAAPAPEILLVGCGGRAVFIPPAVRQRLREAGIVIDAMNTGAACRTYNVLLAEERRVVAALIAID